MVNLDGTVMKGNAKAGVISQEIEKYWKEVIIKTI